MTDIPVDKPEAEQVSSAITRRGLVVFSIVFVVLVFTAANIALKQINRQVRQDTLQSLNAVLNTTRQSLSLWLDQQLDTAQRASQDEKVRETVLYILKNRDTQDRDALSKVIQASLTRYGVFNRQDNERIFFVISRNGRTVASSIRQQTGRTHITKIATPQLLDHAFAGNAVFVPPIVANYMTASNNEVVGQDGQAIMFYLTPVRDIRKKTVAVIATAHNPYHHFSQLNALGRIGETGETYLFNAHGQMLTENRFQQQLIDKALINHGQQNILSVPISRDLEALHAKDSAHETPQNPSMWQSAINRETSQDIIGYINYRDARVIGTWMWLEPYNLGIASEMDLNEALQSYEQTRTLVIMVLFLIAALAASYTLLVFYLGYRTNRALRRVNDQLELRVVERTQQLSEARQAAEQAAKAKGVFLANMSHEIRTPLNAVLGYTQLMEKDRVVNQLQSERLRAIKNAGTHLLGIINEILDISKIEAGAMTLVEEQFDLCQVVSDVNDIFSERCQSKGLVWRMENTLVGEYWSTGDRQKLLQVLINLLGNAVKFTEEGEINFRVTQKKSKIEFTISDTGRGISEADKAIIFKPFQQSTIQSSDGTGLGLSISSKLISMMRGKIRLNSELDIGTTITLSLPLPQILQPSPLPKEKKPTVIGLPEGISKRALVVDDVADNRAVLTQLLQNVGFDTDTACDGIEAQEKLDQHPCDVVLTDIRMPNMDGIALHQSIRSNSEQANMVVIAVSASSLAKNREFYTDEGFNDFIGKPFAFEKIYEILEQHLDFRFERAQSCDASSLLDAGTSNSALIDVRLPDASLIQAIDHAQQGELSKITEFIEWLEQESADKPEYQPLIDILLDHLSRYDMDAIAETLIALRTNAENE